MSTRYQTVENGKIVSKTMPRGNDISKLQPSFEGPMPPPKKYNPNYGLKILKAFIVFLCICAYSLMAFTVICVLIKTYIVIWNNIMNY